MTEKASERKRERETEVECEIQSYSRIAVCIKAAQENKYNTITILSTQTFTHTLKEKDK